MPEQPHCFDSIAAEQRGRPAIASLVRLFGNTDRTIKMIEFVLDPRREQEMRPAVSEREIAVLHVLHMLDLKRAGRLAS
jgi:hypothetical protein